jgi:hypothetical protein
MKIKQIGEIKKHITEKNVPTDPEKWSYAKAQAKKKFDVYPSAYANGWASKKYKELGGSWRKEESVNESTEPEIITQLRDVMKSGYKSIKDPKSGKKMKVDSYSASAIVKVYDALNQTNKDKFSTLGLLGMQNVAFKVLNK